MKQPPNSAPKIARPRLIAWAVKSSRAVLLGMMLALSLACGGCGLLRTPDRIQPAVHQGPQGNAIMTTLPVGALIVLPRGNDAGVFANLFFNEVQPEGQLTNAVRVTGPLKVLTPAYLAERDAAELQLHKRIQELQIKGPK